jgi:hypothetical protein
VLLKNLPKFDPGIMGGGKGPAITANQGDQMSL